MSDPIAGAAARFWTERAAQTPRGLGDTASRAVPVTGDLDGAPSFADNLSRAINGVSSQQENAASTLQAFLRGDDVAVHQVMAATEEAQISLEMLIEVRNKFAEAYRTLTTMQG